MIDRLTAAQVALHRARAARHAGDEGAAAAFLRLAAAHIATDLAAHGAQSEVADALAASVAREVRGLRVIEGGKR
ncbi:MAG: hypothetical protein IT374_26070 [Polyangiaceae bacterium]|nr:hypothetical protein [Polyangiaceae bacterium]